MKIILSWHNIFRRGNEVEVFRRVAKIECSKFELFLIYFFAIVRKSVEILGCHNMFDFDVETKDL